MQEEQISIQKEIFENLTKEIKENLKEKEKNSKILEKEKENEYL